MKCRNFVFDMKKTTFNKDSYIWFSPSGEMFNSFDCDHNGAGIHNRWANEYLVKKYQWDGTDDFIDNWLELNAFLKENKCDYSYEYLEKQGWVRYLPWSGNISAVEGRKYNKALKDSVRSFCIDNGVSLSIFGNKE